MLNARLEKEGLARYELYKDERRRVNISKIQYSRQSAGSVGGVQLPVVQAVPPGRKKSESEFGNICTSYVLQLT